MTTDGTGTAGAAPSAPTLGDEIGALLGEGSWSEPAEDTSSDATGDTPVERQDSTANAVPGSEGDPAAVRPDAPSGDAAAPSPDAVAPTASEDDLLAGASPLTYTVNGESRAFDGIQVLKDRQGAIITPDALSLVERRLGERDHLFEQNQAREKRYQDLDRLTEWRSKTPDGKESVLKGAEALQMRDLGLSMMRAEIAELRAMFDQPATKWLAQDEQGNIVWNTDAFREWNQRLDQSRKIAYHEGRNAFQSVLAQTQAPPAPPTSLTPDQVQQLTPMAVDFAAKQAGISNLSADSRSFLATVARPFLRVATPADLQANPSLKPGQPVVDPDFIDVVKQHAAQQAKAAQTTNTLSEAGRVNAARLAQAALGARGKPGSLPAQKPTAPPSPSEERATRSQQLWDLNERAVSGRR